MKKIILVAGATGNLGERIVNALLGLGVVVRVVVRNTTIETKIIQLQNNGAIVYKVNQFNVSELMDAGKGVDCVVSALAGLRETIIIAK